LATARCSGPLEPRPVLRRAGVGLIIRSARPHWEFSMTRRSPKWIGTS